MDWPTSAMSGGFRPPGALGKAQHKGANNGLGPRFNSNQCFSCHSQPNMGGTSPAKNPLPEVAGLDGAKNAVAIEAEDKWAQGVALRARNELLAAATLAATAILILFLRLKRQEHVVQLQETERNALRESEERFRALTEQSTDIILIADPSGQIKYASPSVHTVLSVHEDSLLGTNMMDLARIIHVSEDKESLICYTCC
jgi:PAS domain-containing protein